MKLQTQIPLEQQQHNQIDYHSKVMLLGSCFSENIGDKFEYFKFQNIVNPFGILFHPLAIEKLITNAINEKKYIEEDVFFLNEQWHCYDAHSKLSKISKEDVLDNLNTQIKLTSKFLKESSHLIITLGTAWVYRLIESDTIVANCHKVPQKKFLKEILSVDAITESLEGIISLVKSINKDISIVFTVSPIRHLKDGFIENTQSKSHLLSAIHQVVEPRKQLYYFPSYEIMMDELRDYRFYSEDMIHPNKISVEYIWNRFSKVWISDKAHTTMQDVDVVQKGLKHKPFNQNSQAYRDFLQNLESKKSILNSNFQHITF